MLTGLGNLGTHGASIAAEMDVEGILTPDRVAAITRGHHPFGMRFDLPGLG